MRLSSMFLAMLFAPLTLAAQYVTGHSSPYRVELRAASACPVGFSVDRKPDGAVIWTNSPQPRVPHGQGLDLNFAKPATQIASVDIVVHGYLPTTHIIPATPSLPAEATETFHLTASAGQPLLHPSVWTQHMVVVSWVELTRIDFADGTTWQSSTPRQCAAAPSLFVPVTASTR
jgi:hypothetical protein